MTLSGYRSPHRALIEANFDQIYEHQAFSAGIASAYLSGEIKAAFDDLQRTGAIKLTQVGADEKLDALITTAYNKLTEMMFSPLGGTGTPSLESLTATAGGAPSMLDRATTMLANNRAESDRQHAAAATTPTTTTPTTTPTQPATTPAATTAGDGQHESPVARERGAQPPTVADSRGAATTPRRLLPLLLPTK